MKLKSKKKSTFVVELDTNEIKFIIFALKHNNCGQCINYLSTEITNNCCGTIAYEFCHNLREEFIQILKYSE